MDGAVYMRYRNLKIGSGPGNDVQLNEIGRCANVSDNHAVIFYDDVTHSFELLNYSEFGSQVNGQLFSCDFTEHPATPAGSSNTVNRPLDDPKSFYANIREIVDKRRDINRMEATAAK